MPVIVHIPAAHITFTSAIDWHVDEEDRLHIRDANKAHIAVFARNEWIYATTVKWSPEKATWLRRQEAGYDAAHGGEK